MNQPLPADLKEAEQQILVGIEASVMSRSASRWTVNLKFEGLKVLSLSINLSRNLLSKNLRHIIAFPDAGATALAKRDYEVMKNNIKSFKDVINNDNIDIPDVLLAIQPQPSDYELFESMASNYSGQIIIVNGRLEDAAVGIGRVARERRKSFIDSWMNCYWLEPLKEGALLHQYPKGWMLYKYTPKGYLFCNEFQNKPTQEEMIDYL